MRLKAGQATYKAPPMGKLLRVLYDENVRGSPGVLSAVEIVASDDITRYSPREQGVPRKVALILGRGWTLQVWPTPKEDARLRVRYYPPAIEW